MIILVAFVKENVIVRNMLGNCLGNKVLQTDKSEKGVIVPLETCLLSTKPLIRF